MPDDEALQRALALAYGYLDRRERTVSEVRARLRRDGLPETAIDEALADLADQGLLDDARFARMFVQDQRHLGQWGSERIRRALRARGLEPELIDAALADAGADAQGEETDLDRAIALLSRRFPSLSDDRRERERALGVLLRKGYDSELAIDAVTAYARGGTPDLP